MDVITGGAMTFTPDPGLHARNYAGVVVLWSSPVIKSDSYDATLGLIEFHAVSATPAFNCFKALLQVFFGLTSDTNIISVSQSS